MATEQHELRQLTQDHVTQATITTRIATRQQTRHGVTRWPTHICAQVYEKQLSHTGADAALLSAPHASSTEKRSW